MKLLVTLLKASNSSTTLDRSLSVFKTAVSELNSVHGRVGEIVKEKVHSIASKNSDMNRFVKLKKF
jgi:hypothetical protein